MVRLYRARPQRFTKALVRSLDRVDLLRALRRVVEELLHEGAEAGELMIRVEPRLRAFLFMQE